MKIARKIDPRRIEHLRKEICRPEYQNRAIQVIASNLAEVMARNKKHNDV